MDNDPKQIINSMKKQMDEAINYLIKEYRSLRTGRASPSLVEDLKVEYHGAIVPLKSLASISIPDPRMIVIQPFDRGSISAIEKAIQKSNLSLNPQVEGNLIRIIIPRLTEENRKQLSKVISQKAEEIKQSIRNARRDAMEKIKDLAKKQKVISEDESNRYQKEIEKITKEYLDKVEKHTEEKNKEILNI
ncbi:MAG: ribosome recycling factor [Candidatus Calescibacterium sp.]|nr:ribosome recycling factor [Candidatus Calescibacterium sp.]MCX7972788.1 ribosome recycling factor [bacterium]MDW8195862.1 ribosome recycling factor [Candidatus Calescibacterium sp.]